MIPIHHPFHFALGLIVWSVWFVAVYGGLSVGCAIAPPASESGSLNWLSGALGAVTVLVFAWLIRQMLKAWRTAHASDAKSRTRFMTTVSAGLYAIAATSTLVIGLPIVGLPPCL